MATEFWLSERQWKRLAPPSPRKSRGVPHVDDGRICFGFRCRLQGLSGFSR